MKRLAPNYVHPKDREALNAMKAIPLFPAAMKAFMNFFNEQMYHGLNMAQKIRITPKQLPKIYAYLPPLVEKLGIDEPELYLEMNPAPNAYTYGDTRAFITITSGLLEYMDEDEIQTVLAHECGHIACGHVLYHTMADMILKGGTALLGGGNVITLSVQYALFAWSRMSEFSADRAAAVALGGSDSLVEVMIRLAGGPKALTDDIDIDEYLKQADQYMEIRDGDLRDKALQLYVRLQNSHPMNAVRAKEIIQWCKSEQFNDIMSAPVNHRICPTCGGVVLKEWKFCNKCGGRIDS